MIIGAMNHPQHEVVEEIEWMGEMGLQFVDLSLEPPKAASWRVDTGAIRAALEKWGMGVVGHTAYYLPFASPFEEVRQGAVVELKRCLEKFAEVGVKWMNLHPDRHVPMHDRGFWVERNIATMREVQGTCERLGVGLMVENLPGAFNTGRELGELLDALPWVGLHLDIGHANLSVERNTTGELVERFGGRIKHVHLHDNKGGDADLHLPLGAGTMDFAKQLKVLKRGGYDGTITLEVFARDREYLKMSAGILRRAWDSLS